MSEFMFECPTCGAGHNDWPNQYEDMVILKSGPVPAPCRAHRPTPNHYIPPAMTSYQHDLPVPIDGRPNRKQKTAVNLDDLTAVKIDLQRPNIIPPSAVSKVLELFASDYKACSDGNKPPCIVDGSIRVYPAVSRYRITVQYDLDAGHGRTINKITTYPQDAFIPQFMYEDGRMVAIIKWFGLYLLSNLYQPVNLVMVRDGDGRDFPTFAEYLTPDSMDIRELWFGMYLADVDTMTDEALLDTLSAILTARGEA